jgi:hypothetical protein
MPTINQLASLNQLSGSDQIPVYSASNGDARRASVSTLLSYIEQAWMSPAFQRVTASPTLAGFTLALPTTASSLFVLLTPTGTMATGTIVLPAAASAADGQEIVLYSSQAVTALSFTLNGATALNGAPSGIPAGGSITLRYDVLSVAWYVISKPASGGGTFTNGTFTPVYNGAGIVGSVQFQAKYQITGNVVTLGLEIVVGAFSSFTFTLATDYFDGIPIFILPAYAGAVVSGTPIGDNFSAIFTRALGTARITFLKPGSLTLGIPAATAIRFTVATYLYS